MVERTITTVRSKNENARRFLQAAADGNLSDLEGASHQELTSSTCSSGCTALHWAAGCNQLETLEYLIIQRQLPVDFAAVKKSKGRTPLHYACRNGCFEAAQWLVQHGADPNVSAKHGVTPFQLAVWQNRLEICRWLVEEMQVDATQTNDFDCGAVHWLGICPSERAKEDRLLPLAHWLAQQPHMNFQLRQRQGHTPMHKAAWGGHVELIRYLREEHQLWDDYPDDAGNYAADLADMANTDHHLEIAKYLREECSSARAQSCAILGVDPSSATTTEIRKAYLEKARQLHPDRNQSTHDDDKPTMDFDALHKAYRHLVDEGGRGNQFNPAHSLQLMLKVSGVGVGEANHVDDAENINCFKARLIAVLLEYGDKGLALSNVKKKWKQVWPREPFPLQNKKSLADFLLENAGDVIELQRHDNSGISVRPKDGCTRKKVVEAAKKELALGMTDATAVVNPVRA